MNTTKEMPKYKCHKEVWALKIQSISTERRMDWDSFIELKEKGYTKIKLDKGFIEKHKPQVWWYYVVYEDWYKSYSSAEVFESWYTKIS